MFRDLTLNSFFWLGLGVLLIAGGLYYGYRGRMYTMSAGLVFLGLGSISSGITNGFNDYSPMGKLLWQIGVPTLLLGLLLTGYSVFRFI